MQLTHAQQSFAQGYPHCPPPAEQVREPQTAARQGELRIEPQAVGPPLPGEFVSSRFESDCARFVSDAKMLARARADALSRRSPLLAS